MNKFVFLFSTLLFSASTLADDTEIYGALAIDEDKRVNSNVLFIMDTSGSMDGIVATGPAYDHSINYPVTDDKKYSDSHVYHDIDSGPDDGHLKTSLRTSGRYDCATEIASLNSAGNANGRFYQIRGGRYYSPPQDGNDSEIVCSGNGAKLYSGNYMRWAHNGVTVHQTRLKTVVDVVKNLTESLDNINLGLMRFDNKSNGGMIDVPVTDIADSGVTISNTLDTYDHSGGTPLTETLYEAALYYRGDAWKYGSYSNPNRSVDDSLTGNNYKTPIESECQKNHIILLTDGEPSSDEGANDEIRDLIKDMTLPSTLSGSCSGDGGCLDELAYWLKNTDNSSSQIGSQDLTLYTIGGFNLEDGVDLLTRAANFGGGRYYPADDTLGLVKALDSIFLDILATDSTFTAPAVSVNAFNASEHRDELFFALFRPDDNVKWAGNLKKYQLLSNGIVVGEDPDVPAISSTTGYFNESISDKWNEDGIPDGKNVELGGMASKMSLVNDPTTRNILSNIVYNDSDPEASEELLSFTTKNTVATKTSFGFSDSTPDSTFTDVHAWSVGVDVLDYDGDRDVTENRRAIGDPLHSEPVIITYGGTNNDPIASIFFGTNEGFIHSLDTVTGQELFSFIPNELHSIQNSYYENIDAAGNKPYGMDGPLTTWIYDENNNNVLLNGEDIETNEWAYLYAGMRRGGDSYFGLNVTSRTTPELLFKIEGSTKTKIVNGKEEQDTGNPFIKLGETWSKMTIGKIKWDGEDKIVAFFGGGYDTDQDNNSVATNDDLGNAIYMVDAATGERIWWASDSGANLNIATMKNSIPASLSAIDISGDGYINYLFAADTGGRVFRIDLNLINKGNTDTKKPFAKGGQIAAISEDNDVTANRRFYNKPNVSLIKDEQSGDYLTISIGSGFRAHPITVKDVNNRFYVIKDYHPYSAPDPYIVKTEEDEGKTDATLGSDGVKADKIYDATKLMKGTATPSEMQKIMTQGGGWYVQMEAEGEKVLAESTTFSDAIIFTSFSPSSSGSGSACGADTGQSRLYMLSQKWAMPVIDLNDDGVIDEKDRSKDLAHSGIAPRPVIIYRKGGGKTIAVGTETIDDSRFEESAPDPDCDGAECEAQVSKCERGNCYVTPVYWRQN